MGLHLADDISSTLVEAKHATAGGMSYLKSSIPYPISEFGEKMFAFPLRNPSIATGPKGNSISKCLSTLYEGVSILQH